LVRIEWANRQRNWSIHRWFLRRGFRASCLGRSVTALIIYSLNWVLIPKNAGEKNTRRTLFILFGVYALSLFAGTSYILWQFTVLELLPADLAEVILLPTFVLNLFIEAIICPVLMKALSPKAWEFTLAAFGNGEARLGHTTCREDVTLSSNLIKLVTSDQHPVYLDH
jgi:hypothetical protein